MPFHVLRFGDLSIEGWSRAGEETWFRIRPPGLALDAGRGPLPLAGAKDLFLTHGHLDHALGVPFILSQRTLHRMASTRVFCPRPMAEPLEALIEAAQGLEGARYCYELCPLAPGDRVEVGRDLAMEAFATDHVVPSLGYHLVRMKRRLHLQYRGLPGPELAALRRQGVETEEREEELWLSYSGDTGPGVFDTEPRLYQSLVLMLECTFLATGYRERGEEYKHIHLKDLVERAGEFRNQAIVLYHLSRRHDLAELRRAVEEELPDLASRIHILGE